MILWIRICPDFMRYLIDKQCLILASDIEFFFSGFLLVDYTLSALFHNSFSLGSAELPGGAWLVILAIV